MEPTFHVVLDLASERFGALAGKAVWRLQRMKASGAYGDDHNHKTLWDEYCFECQNGPTPMLEEAWELTIQQVCSPIVSSLTDAEKRLLYLAADQGISHYDGERDDEVPADEEALLDSTISRLNELAGSRLLPS